MVDIELIHNITDKPTPFANQHLITSVSKSFSVDKPPHGWLALLHSFKEFSQTLSAKLALQSVSNVAHLVATPLSRNL